jgi:hypothetical protein
MNSVKRPAGHLAHSGKHKRIVNAAVDQVPRNHNGAVLGVPVFALSESINDVIGGKPASALKIMPADWLAKARIESSHSATRFMAALTAVAEPSFRALKSDHPEIRAPTEADALAAPCQAWPAALALHTPRAAQAVNLGNSKRSKRSPGQRGV